MFGMASTCSRFTVIWSRTTSAWANWISGLSCSSRHSSVSHSSGRPSGSSWPVSGVGGSSGAPTWVTKSLPAAAVALLGCHEGHPLAVGLDLGLEEIRLVGLADVDQFLRGLYRVLGVLDQLAVILDQPLGGQDLVEGDVDAVDHPQLLGHRLDLGGAGFLLVLGAAEAQLARRDDLLLDEAALKLAGSASAGFVLGADQLAR